MATKDEIIDTNAYSKTCNKVLILGQDGENRISNNNSLPTLDKYQSNIISKKLNLPTANVQTQITNINKSGWLTLSFDFDNPGNLFIGDSSVDITNGFILNATNPSITLSLDDLSKWYVVSDTDNCNLYVIGASLN